MRIIFLWTWNIKVLYIEIPPRKSRVLKNLVDSPLKRFIPKFILLKRPKKIISNPTSLIGRLLIEAESPYPILCKVSGAWRSIGISPENIAALGGRQELWPANISWFPWICSIGCGRPDTRPELSVDPIWSGHRNVYAFHTIGQHTVCAHCACGEDQRPLSSSLAYFSSGVTSLRKGREYWE